MHWVLGLGKPYSGNTIQPKLQSELPKPPEG
jgi:hypothetical protein